MKALQTIIFVLLLTGFSNAAVLTVTRSDDRLIRLPPGGPLSFAPCDSVDCSLLEAVVTAGTLEGDDTIIFAPNVSTVKLTYTILYDPNYLIYPAKGALKIVGRGADVLKIVGGSPLFQIKNRDFSISDVTLTGGTGGNGGAISAMGGTLTLDRVHMDKNGFGVNYSSGGAVEFTGSLIVKNSTFTRNFANHCGAINGVGTISIVNSTFSSNSTFGSPRGFVGEGSAICVNANSTAIVRNTTFTNNQSAGGGAVAVLGGTLNIGNTIIAGNTSPSFQPEILFTGGSIVSAGNNLIGDSAGDSTNTLNPVTYHPSDRLDTPPLLGSLLNNGGRTPTHSLLLGSPAIDAGNNALAADPFDSSALVYDQRGANFTRTVDGNSDGTSIVDIGAFETQPIAAAATVSIAGRVIDSLGRAVSGAVISMTNRQGQTVSARTNFFGFYRFNAVATGNDYTFEIRHKKYKFNVQTTNIRAELATLDFTALP